jgi:hypothetical protein
MGCEPPHARTLCREQVVAAEGGTMRVALYGRVSTAEQSAAMQIEELRAYCIPTNQTLLP